MVPSNVSFLYLSLQDMMSAECTTDMPKRESDDDDSYPMKKDSCDVENTNHQNNYGVKPQTISATRDEHSDDNIISASNGQLLNPAGNDADLQCASISPMCMVTEATHIQPTSGQCDVSWRKNFQVLYLYQ